MPYLGSSRISDHPNASIIFTLSNQHVSSSSPPQITSHALKRHPKLTEAGQSSSRGSQPCGGGEGVPRNDANAVLIPIRCRDDHLSRGLVPLMMPVVIEAVSSEEGEQVRLVTTRARP